MQANWVKINSVIAVSFLAPVFTLLYRLSLASWQILLTRNVFKLHKVLFPPVCNEHFTPKRAFVRTDVVLTEIYK